LEKGRKTSNFQRIELVASTALTLALSPRERGGKGKHPTSKDLRMRMIPTSHLT
jgi:hypothetical protein